MSTSAIVKQIEDMNLSPAEIQELIANLLMKERKKARTDVATYAELLLATLRVAHFSDMSLIDKAGELVQHIRHEQQQEKQDDIAARR